MPPYIIIIPVSLIGTSKKVISLYSQKKKVFYLILQVKCLMQWACDFSAAYISSLVTIVVMGEKGVVSVLFMWLSLITFIDFVDYVDA